MVIRNSSVVLGNPALAARFSLRQVLRLNKNSGPLLIIDYSGRGAMVLDETCKMGLEKKDIQWIDLADRQRPLAFFQLQRSPHFRSVFNRLLSAYSTISEINIQKETIEWACEAAYELAKHGRVGLGALLRTLSAPETRQWFVETGHVPQDLGKLISMLQWVLHFPVMYIFSESINKRDLLQGMISKSITWFELKTEHFERYERILLAKTIESVAEDSVKRLSNELSSSSGPSPFLTIVHLFSVISYARAIPDWIKMSSAFTKHIFVHSLHSSRSPSPYILDWVNNAATLLIIGGMQLEKSRHNKWLSNSEIERINELNTREVFARTAPEHKSVVLQTRKLTYNPSLTITLRKRSKKSLKVIPLRQIVSATEVLSEKYHGHVDLYKELSKIGLLRLGWLRVKKSGSTTSGSDNVTPRQFDKNCDEELAKLSRELRNRAYKSRPLRRIRISKPDGGERLLGVPCVRDTVVQSTCLLLMSPLFEVDFSIYSFAFRPHRNAHQAIAMTRFHLSRENDWVVIADIKKCFDSLDHHVLLRFVSQKISDPDFLKLIQQWLTNDVIEFGETGPTIQGVAQGSVLSPLLANIYLDPLDKHFEKLDIPFVRYADDITIMAKTKVEARKRLKIMEDFLMEPLHLQLKPAKTNFVSIDEGFSFLGFRIDNSGIGIRLKKMQSVKESLCRELKRMGGENADFKQRYESLIRFNSIVRGFRNYFLLSSDEHRIVSQMQELDAYIDQISHFYLDRDFSNDAAWLSRERFSISEKSVCSTHLETIIQQNEQTTGGYKDINSPESEGPWQINELTEGKKILDVTEKEQGRSALFTGSDAIFVEDEDRLFVLQHGCYICLEDNHLVIKKKKKVIHRSAIDTIGLVFLHGKGISISVSSQVALAERDIPVVFAPPYGEPMAVLNPVISHKSFLRKKQILRRDEPDVIYAGQMMISAKLGNQAAVLRYFAKYRKKSAPELAGQLREAAQEIKEYARHIHMIDSTKANIRNEVMGFEGLAASVYWRQIMYMVPSTLEFSGRIKRSAHDSVNQVLNYAYGILYGEVWKAVITEGLDPYFGIIHGSMRDNGSLIFDLIEEFRAPFVDRMIIGMIGRGFVPNMNKDGLLNTRTRKKIAKNFTKKWSKTIHWRSKRLRPAEILTKQARNLSQLFMDHKEYKPFRMKW